MQTAAQLTIDLPFVVRRAPVHSGDGLTRQECRAMCRMAARYIERSGCAVTDDDVADYYRALAKLKRKAYGSHKERRHGRGRRKA